MSKSKPAWPRMAPAQQPGLAPALQHGLQRFEQVAVFAAQVDQPAARADQPGGDAHALDHRVGMAREQHAVLEGAGLALVGIAHHHVLAARRLAAQRPFQPGGKARAAAAAQVALLHLGQHARDAARQRRRQCRARRRRLGQQHVGAADMVLHLEPFGRPLRHRHAAADQRGHLRHARGIQPGDDLVVVDQQRRALVAQAGAGGGVHADQPVLADAAGRHAQAAAQVGHQRLAAEQTVGDVVAEQDAVLAHRLGVEEAVEAGHALHLGQRQAQAGGHLGQRRARQPAVLRLQARAGSAPAHAGRGHGAPAAARCRGLHGQEHSAVAAWIPFG